MKHTAKTRFRQTTAALVALTLVLSALGPVGTVAAAPSVTVTQTPNSATVAPGDTVEITTQFAVTELNAPQLSAALPDGWTIESQTAEGPAAYNGEGTWQWLAGDADGVDVSYAVTYTVAVPADAAPGDYAVGTDGSALAPSGSPTSDSATTTVTVAEEQPNAPPTADAGGDLAVDEGATATLDASASSDADGDDLTYSWTQTGDGPTVSLSDASAEQPTFTAPDVAEETTLTFEVEVADGNGGSDTDAVSVTVQPVNEQPTVSVAGPTTAQAGAQLDFEATASDADGSITSYEWTFGDGANASGQSVSHAYAAAGDYTVQVTVTDDEGATATATQTVSVGQAPPENQPPTADAGSDQTVTEGETVTLDASASSDADGDALSYAWTQTGGTAVTLSDASSAAPTFTAPDVAEATTLTFAVNVSDGDAADTDAVSVTVQPDEPDEPANAAPSADAGSDQTVDAGASVSLDASGSTDADGDDLTYSWTQTGGGPTVTLSDASAAQPTFAAPDVTEATTLTFEVSVSDGNDSDVDSVSVTVQPDAPQTGDAPQTTARLEPPSDLLGVNQTGGYDVVVDPADGGVGAYSITVSLSNASVGNITGVELAGGDGLSEVQVADDGSSVTVDAVLVDTNDTGPVTLGTVSVEGVAEGESTLTLAVTTLGTEAGNAYDVTGVEGSSLTVSTLVVGDSENPAADGDGDGLHEDVNGDGEVNVLDVQTLFYYRNSDVTVSNPDAFDYNGDGTFDILDVQWLYHNEVAPNEEEA